jgi:hypothetical protein
MAASLSCARWARYNRLSAATGTCDGACRHYAYCKGDRAPRVMQRCMAECRDIYVYDGVEDEESLMAFEGLDCKAAIGFVEGNGGQAHTATSQRVQGERSSTP